MVALTGEESEQTKGTSSACREIHQRREREEKEKEGESRSGKDDGVGTWGKSQYKNASHRTRNPALGVPV